MQNQCHVKSQNACSLSDLVLVPPIQLMGVEPLQEGWFYNFEVRRDIEIPGDKETMVTDMQRLLITNPARRIFRLFKDDFRQNRIPNRLKGLSNKGGTDRPGRIATSQRK